MFVALLPLSVAAGELQSDLIPLDHLVMTDGPASGVAVILSDAAGWSKREDQIAAKLHDQKIAVVGVDMPEYLAKIARNSDDCAYLVSDIEGLSQQIQRASGTVGYTPPIVIGTGLGGGLALDITTQTPDVTIGATIAVDPVSAVPLPMELCTPAGYFTQARGEVYALPPGEQEDPVGIYLSANVANDIRNRVEEFKAAATNVTVSENTVPSVDTLVADIKARLGQAHDATGALPIALLPAKPTHDTMAIILSGDGGWRDLDKTIGQALQADGVPVVGLDSLHYFWSKRTPQQTATDVAALIKKYHHEWSVNHVILIGYSFGADVLPQTYLAMPEAQRNRVKMISLLGFSTAADWEISVNGWLGSHSSEATPTGPSAAQLPAGKLQCIYGSDEEDSGCPTIAQIGGELLKVEGGHHFDGDYNALEKDVLDAYLRRNEQLASSAPLK